MKTKNVFGVFRVQKIKVSNGGGLAKRIKHATRENLADNVDKTRCHLNEFHGPKTYAETKKQIQKLWEKVDTKRSDSVGVLESVVTTTGKLPKGREEDFLDKCVEELKKLYGDNLVGYYIHRDEKETHIHAFSVPLETKQVEKKHLSADELQKVKEKCEDRKIKFLNPPKKPADGADPKEWEKFKKDKKEYARFKKEVKPILAELNFTKTETTLSCQSICGSAWTLSQMQDRWHENVFKHFGLERGEKKEKLTKDKYRNPTSVKKWADAVERKEHEIDQRIENESEELLLLYKSKREGFLRGKDESQRIHQFDLPDVERRENAKEYRNRIQPQVDALLDSAKIFETNYWKLRRNTDAEIQKVRSESLEEARQAQKKHEVDINDLLKKNDELTKKLTKTKSKLRGWRQMSPDDLRTRASQIEKFHCRNAEEYNQRLRDQGYSIADD